eukprot:14883485-Alexandrium_andersonii.AAC.1
MAERRLRYGVLPAGALDLRPGPDGASWVFDLPPRAGDQVCDLPVAVPLDWQPAVHRLAWSQSRREPP